jgi:dolichol-phosphate mannosyltransferase
MLSIVVPVFNEAESLRQLHKELSDVAEKNDYELDIVFVNDGSTDDSWAVIQELSESDRRVRGICFRRNFGKAAALSAGFEAVRGDLVMTLDADLQDDPKEIPRFLEAMEKVDVVSGWKQTRHDPWHKVFPSRIFNWLVSRLTGVELHDHNCGFKCYRREIFYELRLYGELHRFVPVLAAARGWRVGEIVVEHRARQHGRSKYGLLRIPKGFLDLLTVKFLTGFGQRPQHLIGTIGLCFFSVGAIGITILTAMWIITRMIDGIEPLHLTQRAIFFYCLGAGLLGAQLVSIGFIAELITSTQGRNADTYSVAERAGGEASWRSIDDRRTHRHRDGESSDNRQRTEAATDPNPKARKSDIPNG